MDTNDRPNMNLPARFSAALPPVREFTSGPALDRAAGPSVQINSRVVLRALARHWWRILGLWLVVSAPIAFLIYMVIPPTYEVASLLRIEAAQPEILGSLGKGGIEVQQKTYLKTQVGLITSNRVLNPAIADPLVVNLPMIKDYKDPKANLVEKLKVTILEDTNLIRVALELPNPDEAVTIVQSVVQSYLAQNTDYSRSANRDLTESLKLQLVKIEDEIKSKRESIRELYRKGNIVVKPEDRLNTTSSTDGGTLQPTFKTVSEAHVQKMMAEIDQTELELIEAMSMLDVKREAYKARRDESQQLDAGK